MNCNDPDYRMTITPMRLTGSNDITPNMTASANRYNQKTLSQIIETRGQRNTDSKITDFNQKTISQILETRDARKTADSKITDYQGQKLDTMTFMEDNRFLGVDVQIDIESNKPMFRNQNNEIS